MKIKVLGPGCKNCVTLADNVKAALSEMGLEAEMEKVEDFAEIAQYGILSTPGLILDDKVVSYGKVLKPKEIIALIEKNKID